MQTQTQSRKLRICLWIANQLRLHHEGLTLVELNQEFVRNEDLSHGQPLLKNTMLNYKAAILDMFGMVVECNRHNNRYHIDVEDTDELSNWLLNSFSLGQLVREQEEVRERILLEPTPLGMRFFQRVVEAVRQQIPLQLTYQKFADDEPYTCRLDPYSLKLNDGRWYIVGRKDGRNFLQCFAFDRIAHLSLCEGEHFTFDLPFDPQTYFAHSYGIFVSDKVEEVVLHVYGAAYHYLHTKPLHASQQERLLSDPSTPDADRVWEFRYHISVLPDFRNELLRWGAGIEIIQPLHLREEIKADLKKALQRYEEE